MCKTIIKDTRQQRGKHVIKDEWWAAHGVNTVRKQLDFGDYMVDGSNISIDTKRSVQEIAQNINGRAHDRFKRECIRARDAGYRLIILVENRDGVACDSDLITWVNDHCRACGYYRNSKCNPNDTGKCSKHSTRKPIQGARLMRAMRTMQDRYGVRFMFCAPKDSARIICDLLGVTYEQDATSSA